jgi:apolipoprotein N-acyltransferase
MLEELLFKKFLNEKHSWFQVVWGILNVLSIILAIIFSILLLAYNAWKPLTGLVLFFGIYTISFRLYLNYLVELFRKELNDTRK